MDRNQKLAILQAASDENLSLALDALGIQLDDDMYGEGGGVGDENRVPVWSELEVNVPDEGRGPIHTKSDLFGVGKEKVQTNMYGMPTGDEEEGGSMMGIV